MLPVKLSNYQIINFPYIFSLSSGFLYQFLLKKFVKLTEVCKIDRLMILCQASRLIEICMMIPITGRLSPRQNDLHSCCKWQ